MERFGLGKDKQREVSTHVSLPLLGNGFPLLSLFPFYSIQPRAVGQSRCRFGRGRTLSGPYYCSFPSCSL
jgi:hypothetical protein